MTDVYIHQTIFIVCIDIIKMPGPGFELRTVRCISSALIIFQPQGAQIEAKEGKVGKLGKYDLKAAVG